MTRCLLVASATAQVAGVGRHVEHWLTITHTYDDGPTTRHTIPHHHTTATDAHHARRARLREAGTPHEHGPGWIQYRVQSPQHPEPCTVRLDYHTEDPDAD